MKNEVGTPVIVAIIVVVLLVLGGIAWSVFGKKGGGGHVDAEEKFFQEHPDMVAKYKQGSAAGPGAMPGSGGSPRSGGGPGR